MSVAKHKAACQWLENHNFTRVEYDGKHIKYTKYHQAMNLISTRWVAESGLIFFGSDIKSAYISQVWNQVWRTQEGL